MTAHERTYMIESEARRRIRRIVGKLREMNRIGTETKAMDDSSSVEYHIRHIRKAGGGIWNESFAKDYIENLEAEVGRTMTSREHFAY